MLDNFRMSSSSVVGQIASGQGFGGTWVQNVFGKPNTVGGMIGQTLTGGLDPATQGIQAGFNSLTQKPADPNSPGAPPTLPSATMTALQSQLQNEVRLRASNTLLTGGTGLIQPASSRTASQSLMGS